MKCLFILLTLCFVPNFVLAQNNAYQLRLPFHTQVFSDTKVPTRDRFGLALWGILPDVNAEKGRATTLVVGGLVWQHNKKNWVEFMVGARLNQNGYKDPILNIRLLNNQIPRVAVSGEIQQSFREARRRTLYWAAVDTPTGIWKLRAGLETENVHFFEKSNSVGLGPRVAFPLPWTFSSKAKMSAITTYQFRNDKNFVRVYIITNLSFGEK